LTFENTEITATIETLTAQYPGCVVWTCEAGHTTDDRQVLDALVYRNVDEMESDEDNTGAIARALVLA
jgi:hypothetical protein